MIDKLSSLLQRKLQPLMPAATAKPVLGSVVGRLKRVAVTPIPDDPAAAGTFLTKSHRGDAGARAYKLYVPGSYAGSPVPLVVMLHGCTQSPDDFAAGTRMNAMADERGFLVAYPAQSASANTAKCWNWFNASDQRRDAGEPSLLAGITRDVMREFAIDPRRVYVAGLSAGGAAAAILGALYPDVYAAIGVHSGLPPGAARNLPTALSAMRHGADAYAPAEALDHAKPLHTVPTIVFHGTRDTTVHPSNGAALIARNDVRTLRASEHAGRVSGGRSYRRIVHAVDDTRNLLEHWIVDDAGHAWSGGSAAGSYTDPLGPDASREMVRFFEQHALPESTLRVAR